MIFGEIDAFLYLRNCLIDEIQCFRSMASLVGFGYLQFCLCSPECREGIFHMRLAAQSKANPNSTNQGCY